MVENFSIGNQGICELADKLSLSDVLCPTNKPLLSPTEKSTSSDSKHLHDSPFASEPINKPVQPSKGNGSDNGGAAPPEPSVKPGEWPRTSPPDIAPLPKLPAPKLAPEPLSPVPAPKEKHLPTVYLDIGHCTSKDGGHVDHGFESDTYNECQINQAVGKDLIQDLQTAGFRVVPTWNPDAPPPMASKQADLQRRNEVVNADIAKNGGDSIYLSIHHDEDSSGKSGQCVFVAEPKMNEGMTLARSIQNSTWRVRERANAPQCINSDTVTHNGKLVGLRGVNTIGVLVEAANVNNSADHANMPRTDFQKLEASKITQGVVNYFHLKQGSQRP